MTMFSNKWDNKFELKKIYTRLKEILLKGLILPNAFIPLKIHLGTGFNSIFSSSKIPYLILGSILIVLWQVFLIPNSIIDQKYGRHDGSGLIYNQASTFVYFHYYLNMYPIRSTYEDKTYSKEGAQYIIDNKPDTLYNDNSYYIVWGEHGKEWLLLLSSYIKNTPDKPTVIPVNASIFIISLLILFIIFSIYNQRVLSVILVILLGSNPFQIYEVYKTENIFGLGLSLLIIIIAINSYTIFSHNNRSFLVFTTSIFSGLIVGALTHIRMEYTVIALSFFFLIFCSSLKIKLKLAASLAFILTMVTVSSALGMYFNYKIAHSVEFVKNLNDNDDLDIISRRNYHTIWHPLVIGLGDFDYKYGYKWEDHMAYKLARPILKERYPDRYQKMEPGEFMSVHPEYHQILKEEFLGRIKSDPLWYVEILLKRLYKMVTNSTPISINVNFMKADISLKPLYLLPVLIYFILNKRWEYVKLILSSVFISLSVVGIHSLHGITNLTVFHYFIAAIILREAFRKISL